MNELAHRVLPISRRPTGELVRALVRNDLLRNSSFMIMSILITSGLGAAFWVIAARAYSTETLGLSAALVSTMTVTASLCTFGMQATLVYRLPRRGDGAEASATLMAGMVGTGVLSAVGGTAVVLVLPHVAGRFGTLDRNVLYGVAFVAGCVLMTTSTVLDYTFVAERCTGKMTIRNAVFAAAKIPLVVAAPALGVAGTLGILGSWAAAAMLGATTAAMLVARLRRGYRPTVHGTRAEFRAMLPSLPLQHTITMASGLTPFVLSPLVAAQLSPRANAYFYTTWMVGSVFFIISPAVSWSLFAEGRRANVQLASTVRRATLVTSALLGPLMIGFVLFGRYALLLFGGSYVSHGHGLLTILVLSAAPDAVTNLYTGAMRVRGTLLPAAVLNVAMAVLTLVVARLLLPRLGIVGAGWAWLLAQSAGCVFVAIHVAVIRRGRSPRRQ